MDLTRRRHVTFLTICALILINVYFTSTATPWVNTLPFYMDPEENWMYNIAVDNEDNVYAGGYNTIVKLSPDLKAKQTVMMGPVMDHLDCMHPAYPCVARKASTDNHNRVLKVVYNLGLRPSLLVCGSVYRTVCQIRPVDNITDYHWIHPFNESLGYTTRESLDYIAYSYFGPGYDNPETLILASPMDVEGANYEPFISSRVVEKDGDSYKFRYSFQNGTAKSALLFSTWAERIVKDGGVAHDGYVYFLVLYSSMIMNEEEDTRIVRVCIQDGTFQSYSELPIACDHPTGQMKSNAWTLHLNDSPSSDGKSFYVSFIRLDGDHPGTALCIFPMADVIRAFTTFPRECLNVVGQDCEQEMKTNITDFCGPDVRPYFVSKPLVVPHFMFLPNTRVTSITAVKNQNEMVAIIGDVSGDVQKIRLTSRQIISKNRLFDINSTSRIWTPFVFDRDHQHIYVFKEAEIVKFPVASCRVHETCELCFTEGKNDPLNCGWCGRYCAHIDECEDPDSFSRDTCSPSISEVFPQKGPIQGGATINITGDNFGPYVAEGDYSITVAGIPCEIFNWQNEEIICSLGPAPEETSGPVELNVTVSNSSLMSYNISGSITSQLNFSYYLGPRLFGIQPNKGPISGGTNVSLFGENLDYENSKDRSIIVRGRLCNLSGFNTTTARCVTGNEIIPDYPDKIAILVGDVIYTMEENPPPDLKQRNMSQYYEYISDPEIFQIQPGSTTVSGLVNVTVAGLYLDSVVSPQIVVKITRSTNLEFHEECWSDPQSRGTKLTCTTPAILGQHWLPIITSTSPLLTHVSFIMDGVQWVRNLTLHQELKNRLFYYPDPEFTPFGEIEKVPDDQTTIEIKGNNYLDHLHSANNFHIRLGDNDTCKITIVTPELLTCELPPHLTNSSAIGTNITVRVFIGSTSNHLGYIKFVDMEENMVILEHILLATYILSPFFVIMVVYIGYREIRKKKVLRKTSKALSISNRTEISYDYPPVPPRLSLQSSDSVSNAKDNQDMLILDSERMFIFEELGLIIQREHLQIGELIGSGQFGKVYKGTLQIHNQKETEVAVKSLYRHLWRNPIKADLFMKEALTMKEFDHPHIMGLLGVCFEGSVPHIVLPFMENGDLCNYIRDKTKTLLVSDLLKFAVDIASGMCYLAKVKFVHRDLAARNCVLDSSMRAKVADFGLSRDIYEGNYYRSQDKHAELPFRWTAPEVIESQISTTQSDVWSYGVFLWELMTRGSIPYSNIGNWDIIPYIKLGNRLNQPQFCPKPLYLSMLACWNIDSKKRPTFFKLHSYVSEMHCKLLNEAVTETSAPSGPVTENALYFHITVPAQNTVYYDSKELYLKMEGQTLIEDLVEAYVVMQDFEEKKAVMEDENIVTDKTKC